MSTRKRLADLASAGFARASFASSASASAVSTARASLNTGACKSFDASGRVKSSLANTRPRTRAHARSFAADAQAGAPTGTSRRYASLSELHRPRRATVGGLLWHELVRDDGEPARGGERDGRVRMHRGRHHHRGGRGYGERYFARSRTAGVLDGGAGVLVDRGGHGVGDVLRLGEREETVWIYR